MGRNSHEMGAISNVLQYLENALEEKFDKLLTHPHGNILLLLVLLNHLFNFVTNLLTAILD
jgi:Fe2+ transport system protein B